MDLWFAYERSNLHERRYGASMYQFRDMTRMQDANCAPASVEVPSRFTGMFFREDSAGTKVYGERLTSPEDLVALSSKDEVKIRQVLRKHVRRVQSKVVPDGAWPFDAAPTALPVTHLKASS